MGGFAPHSEALLAFPSDDTTKSFPHRDATARHRRTPPYRKITVERRSRPAGREWWTRRSEPPHSSTRPTTTRSTASSGGSWPRRRSTSAPQPAGARRVCTCTRVHELSAQARRRSEDLTPAASTTSERSAMLAHPSTGLVARAPCQLRQSHARPVRPRARASASSLPEGGPPFPCLTVVGRERGGRDFVYADSSKSARLK